MGLFSLFKKPTVDASANSGADKSAWMAEMALNAITDGVLLVDANRIIRFANPAASTMTGYGSADNVIGLEYNSVLKLENAEGSPIPEEQNHLSVAMQSNQPLSTREYLLVTAQSEKRIPIALTLIPTGNARSHRIITFRNITKELEDENAQTEFISTASHEMRTPVASIEGYLGLALNPATATIDERARQYLDAAHKASQHLGRLFKDLLDVTKLDDGRDRLHLVPIEVTSAVREMAAAHEKEMAEKHLKYSFGAAGSLHDGHKVHQLVYASVDLDFLREVLDNLIENAIKYTPEGGEIWVNARGDGDKVLINVTDTGIGIAADDMAHIFQKFYRVDNSQTRQIGGTGLGLYLVKQRVEALGGRVWVESAFGDGSTFFVSLPRINETEFKRRQIAYLNEQAVKNFAHGGLVRSSFDAAVAPSISSQSVAAPSQPINSVPVATTPVATTPVATTPVATTPVATTPTQVAGGVAAPNVSGLSPNSQPMQQGVGNTAASNRAEITATPKATGSVMPGTSGSAAPTMNPPIAMSQSSISNPPKAS